MHISGTYQPIKWDEHPYETIEGRMKSTRASVTFAFSGNFEGTAQLEYLMFYTSFDPADSHRATAQYRGLMRLSGRLHGQAGSFSLFDEGTFAEGGARSTLTIVAGSGTEALTAISGSGGYSADAQGCRWELDVSLASPA